MVAGSAAILGHSSLGASRIALTRAISAARASGVGIRSMAERYCLLSPVRRAFLIEAGPETGSGERSRTTILGRTM